MTRSESSRSVNANYYVQTNNQSVSPLALTTSPPNPPQSQIHHQIFSPPSHQNAYLRRMKHQQKRKASPVFGKPRYSVPVGNNKGNNLKLPPVQRPPQLVEAENLGLALRDFENEPPGRMGTSKYLFSNSTGLRGFNVQQSSPDGHDVLPQFEIDQF